MSDMSSKLLSCARRPGNTGLECEFISAGCCVGDVSALVTLMSTDDAEQSRSLGDCLAAMLGLTADGLTLNELLLGDDVFKLFSSLFSTVFVSPRVTVDVGETP